MVRVLGGWPRKDLPWAGPASPDRTVRHLRLRRKQPETAIAMQVGNCIARGARPRLNNLFRPCVIPKKQRFFA
jgi:hypothetical protein